MELFDHIVDKFRCNGRLQVGATNAAGDFATPFEVKVLAALRRLSRGETWDTITELAGDDSVGSETLRQFSHKFYAIFREEFEDDWVHPPREGTQLQSVLRDSARAGLPGCVGFLDGVHCKWDRCPYAVRHLHKGKCPYPTLGWSVSCNWRRRFTSVLDAMSGGCNDKTAQHHDHFVKALQTDPLFTDNEYDLFTAHDLTSVRVKGLWLCVDGGYTDIPALISGDPDSLEAAMNTFTHWIESCRKHIECSFGILKGRFRILKLPLVDQSSKVGVRIEW